MTGVNVIGVQFRKAGRIYDFDGKNLLLAVGDRVVVETERGPSMAEVIRIAFKQLNDKEQGRLKPILRVATNSDLSTDGHVSPEHVQKFTQEQVERLKLEMAVIGAEVQMGGNKVIIYFTAPGRVDFRELVKDLAGGLKTRVELKQVGARDEAKQIGGVGICGREFCCSSFLREFVPVSIKMAKNQNLALNPSKVSGGCGRLLCCLIYEDDTYKQLRKKLPPRKAQVELTDYDGRPATVIKSDILNQVVVVETEGGEQLQVAAHRLKWSPAAKKSPGGQNDRKPKTEQPKEPRDSEQGQWTDDIDLLDLMEETKPENSSSDQGSHQQSSRGPNKKPGNRPRRRGRRKPRPKAE